MPATFGIAAVSVAGKARSYAARLSLVVACGDGGSPESAIGSFPAGPVQAQFNNWESRAVGRVRGPIAVTRHEFARRRPLVFSRKASLVGLRDTPANPTYALRIDGNHNIF